MTYPILFALFVVLLLGQTLSAQTPASTPKTVSGGVINGKSTKLVKPVYPASAQAERATGAVNVLVTISEEGKVISAEAVSGHPLLRDASVQAALASTFNPTTLEGIPVKVTGIIVYNFVLPMSLIEMGFELARAERFEKDRELVLFSSIGAGLPESMTEERKDLTRLAKRYYVAPVEPKKEQTAGTESYSVGRYDPNKPQPNNNQTNEAKSSNEGRYQPDKVTVVAEPLITDPTQLIRELRVRIFERLDSPRAWLFSLGAKLQLLESELSDNERTKANLDDLTIHADNAPVRIAPDFVKKLRALIAVGERRDEESLKLIRELIPIWRK